MRKRRDPKYRHHKARNLAVVRIEGKDHYLGPYESEESIARYHLLIADWRAGKCDSNNQLAENQNKRKDSGITVIELAAKYSHFAAGYYTKDGRPTQPGINVALRYLKTFFGTWKAKEFGPKALAELRETMIADGHSRRYINDNIHRIKRCFRWATIEELVPGTTYQALRALPSLGKGRTKAREVPPVSAIDIQTIQATIDQLSSVVADMVRVQLLTATRPSEICRMKWSELDQDELIWTFEPESHKTDHHG